VSVAYDGSLNLSTDWPALLQGAKNRGSGTFTDFSHFLGPYGLRDGEDSDIMVPVVRAGRQDLSGPAQ
jgi:hypothetical protein